VAPDGNSTGAGDPEWGDPVHGRVQIETFVTGALINAVEGGLRRDRGHHAVAGFSMGGYGAANLALRHPDLYGQFVSLAGYFHIDDLSGVFGDDPDVQAADSPDRHLAEARREHVMLIDGADDDLPLTRRESQRFAGLLRGAGVPVSVSIVAGTHGWACHVVVANHGTVPGPRLELTAPQVVTAGMGPTLCRQVSRCNGRRRR
jgi:S-formylglutathione hydrolase FrmB